MDYASRFSSDSSDSKSESIGRLVRRSRKSLEVIRFVPRWIINFPTKQHWRNPSKLEFVRDGLEDFVRVIESHGMTSVALPALGCGAGGLEWKAVRALLEASLEPVNNVAFEIFEPRIEKVSTH